MNNYLDLFQSISHYGQHFLVPGLIAYLFFRDQWKKAWLIMLVTMLVDLDHFLAEPVFSPDRCSIGFHPLHTEWAIGLYLILFFFPKSRILALGLLYHMLTDYQDCLWMWYINP